MTKKKESLGTYVTPWGKYTNRDKAAKHPDCTISSGTLAYRCLNANRILKPHYRIPSEWVGLTWKEVGFWFIPKTFKPKEPS